MNNILITGVSGFVGRNMLKYFSSLECHGNQFHIIGTTRNIERLRNSNRISDNVDYVEIGKHGDFTVDDSVDYIICTAGITDKKSINESPADTWLQNVSNTYYALEFAREKKVKGFTYVSSCSVYGKKPQFLDERAFIDSFSIVDDPYGNSKIASESLCLQYLKEWDVPVKIVRLFQVYGDDWPYIRGTFFSDCIRAYIENRNIIIHSDGLAIRNYIHVDDVSSALWKIATEGDNGVIYDLGSDLNNLSLIELSKIVCDEAQKRGRNISYVVEGKNNGMDRVDIQKPDNSKIKSMGWIEKKDDIKNQISMIFDSVDRHIANT